jgi:hypothetical protein
MTLRISLALVTLATLVGVTSLVQAQTPQIVTIDVAAEVLASRVTMPTGPDSSITVLPCSGCTPKTHQATAATLYFKGKEQVSLAELTALVQSRPNALLTVKYSAQTGELISVTADVW